MPLGRGTSLIVVASILGSSCAGSSPGSPTAPGGAPVVSYRGETLSAIDGSAIAGVAIRVGTREALSDNHGRFEMTDLKEGSTVVTLSGPSIVERRRNVAIPADASRETLIPSAFDLDAFDEMFRGTGRLQRWTSSPALVVLGSVMRYEGLGSDEYQATSTRLTEDEIALLIAHLTEGLSLLSGGRFTSFSSILVERPDAGDRVNTLRTGAIVVGRYRGVQTLSSTIGLGRWSTAGNSAEVIGGAMYLENNFDRDDPARRLLRIHELGHALGYRHVTKRISIMNPAIGPLPTEFDRSAAMIAFERTPGNLSPDDDVTSTPRSPGGFGGSLTARPVWSPVMP
jgi:hypothetical protein